ncbi:hypothetical protein [Aliarcobacter butzleri]|uniref:hypothetical protein n=1 Tax=Aliarcobacter butzleri TaxID=28197 RepID=UPI003AF92FB2
MNIFKNKEVLFIAPKFYNYHTQISNFIELNGGKVTFFAEDIYTSWYRFLNRIFPKVSDYFKQKYRSEILDSAKVNNYDFVFVIRGGILTADMIKKLSLELQNAKFIMYQWDSNKQSNYKNIIEHFDVVKTFDRQDAIKFGIEYLPLYYSKEYEDIRNNRVDKLYDIVFYGAYHSDRLNLVKYIDSFCKQNNLNFKYHLFITKMALIRLLILRILKIKDMAFLKTYSVKTNNIIDIYKQSFSVLDIELSIQDGLTMRTFETLGSELKLITTNKNISKESFYDQNNIMILDRKNINLDLNFFKTSFKTDEKLLQYSFEHWISNLFKDTNGSIIE